MADLLQRTPDLDIQKKLEQQVEHTVGQEVAAEPASAENLELIQPMVEQIRQGGEPAALEAAVEPAPQPDIADVLETQPSLKAVSPESAVQVDEKTKKMLNAFLAGDLNVSAGEVTLAVKPDTETYED